VADKIRVNTDSLNRTRENVANQIKQIRGQITNMYGEITALNSMWEGEAHAAFDTHFKSDVKNLENLCKSLDGIVNYENNAVTEYNRCERNVASLINSIKV